MRRTWKCRTTKLGGVHCVKTWGGVCRFSLPSQGVWGLSVPDVMVRGAVSPGPCGRSAEWRADLCAVLHSILGELTFVKRKALRPVAFEDCANCTLIPFPFHLHEFFFFDF